MFKKRNKKSKLIKALMANGVLCVSTDSKTVNHKVGSKMMPVPIRKYTTEQFSDEVLFAEKVYLYNVAEDFIEAGIILRMTGYFMKE